MNSLLRTAFGSVAVVSVALLSGCYVSVESGTRFEGTPLNASAEFQSGKAVRIISNNGNVTVVGGSSDNSVGVTYQPFILEKDDNEDGAKEQMESDLVMETTDGAEEVLIKVTRKEGASGNLGADIKVVLPSGFDGAFTVVQNNGQIEADLRGGRPAKTVVDSDNGGIKVLGAAGDVSIVADNGSGTVSVAAWPTAGEHAVKLGNGDLDFSLPSETNGTMTAFADGGVVDDATIPSSWASEVAAEGSKSYTMGTGEGGLLKLSTDLGDITITPN